LAEAQEFNFKIRLAELHLLFEFKALLHDIIHLNNHRCRGEEEEEEA
jgi:hypothetical protein